MILATQSSTTIQSITTSTHHTRSSRSRVGPNIVNVGQRRLWHRHSRLEFTVSAVTTTSYQLTMHRVSFLKCSIHKISEAHYVDIDTYTGWAKKDCFIHRSFKNIRAFVTSAVMTLSLFNICSPSDNINIIIIIITSSNGSSSSATVSVCNVPATNSTHTHHQVIYKAVQSTQSADIRIYQFSKMKT